MQRFSREEAREEKLQKQEKPLLSYLRNSHFMAISIASALDAFASSPFFLFLPFLLLHKGVNPVFLGPFTAIYLLGNFTGKTLLGRVSDMLGSTKTFIFSEIANVIFIFLLLLPLHQFVIIIISFLLGTLTKGTSPVIATLITESMNLDDNYQQAFAVNTFILNIATIISPFILGILSNTYSLNVAFYVMALTTFLAIFPVIGYATIKERKLSTKVVTEIKEEEIISQ